jgi:hypothetical protein
MIELPRVRLLMLVLVVAAMASATTWAVITYAVDRSTERLAPGAPVTFSQPEAAHETPLTSSG